jgi:type IV pilus assembly protein PilO
MKALAFNLEDIRNLDIKEIPNWPLTGRLAVLSLVGILTAFVFFIVDGWPKLDRIAKLQKEEERLLEEVKLNQNKIRYKDLYLTYYKENQEKLEKAIGEIPPARDVAEVFAIFNETAQTKGVTIGTFTPRQLLDHTLYSEQLIDMSITGSFNQLGQFVAGIAKLPYVVYFQDTLLTTGQSYLKLETTASVLLQREP